jgi:hypothetical protein
MVAVLAGRRVEYETEVHYKDISPRFVHVTYAPDKDQFDCVRGWVASITDITVRKQAEVALRQADLRLRRLASIVEFSVMLSQSDTSEGLKRAIQGRIQALANVHSLL